VRHGGHQVLFEPVQDGLDGLVVQAHQLQRHLGPARPGVDAVFAAVVGRALAGQDADRLGALQGVDDLQHALAVGPGLGRRDAHGVVAVAGAKNQPWQQGGEADRGEGGHTHSGGPFSLPFEQKQPLFQ
jgi:hypothetical protein